MRMTGVAAEDDSAARTRLRKSLDSKTIHLPRFPLTEKGVRPHYEEKGSDPFLGASDKLLKNGSKGTKKQNGV